MSLFNRLPGILLGSVFLAMGAAHAEDPFLGQIKDIKCVNCKPGWVTLVVHDPIETRDFELYLKDTDYNKIITPLPGKRIHDRNGECFYWMERPKAVKPSGPASTPGAPDAKTPPNEAVVGKTAAGKPESKSGSAQNAPGGDSAATGASSPSVDSSNGLPPPMEENLGTPSTCIRFFRQTN